MATVALKRSTRQALKKAEPTEYGPRAAGIRMTLREFDRAEFVEGYRYELINGVLVVSPIPSLQERTPNEYLGHVLLSYRENHPQGTCLDLTAPEQTVLTLTNRRRADRVIWLGLGRRPRRRDVPSIIAEFVSKAKRDRLRDYVEKRDEYMAVGVGEYWVIDRFQRTLTVFSLVGGKIKTRTIREKQTYKTPLLPGFELPLAKLLAVADACPDLGDDED
jgi:Uma2 family endonuclease